MSEQAMRCRYCGTDHDPNTTLCRRASDSIFPPRTRDLLIAALACIEAPENGIPDLGGATRLLRTALDQAPFDPEDEPNPPATREAVASCGLPLTVNGHAAYCILSAGHDGSHHYGWTALAEPRHEHACNRPEDAPEHSICRCNCGATALNTMGEAEWSSPPTPTCPDCGADVMTIVGEGREPEVIDVVGPRTGMPHQCAYSIKRIQVPGHSPGHPETPAADRPHE